MAFNLLPFLDSGSHYNATTFAGIWSAFSMATNITGGRTGINGCIFGNLGQNATQNFANTSAIGVGSGIWTNVWGNPPLEIRGPTSLYPDVKLQFNGDGTLALFLQQFSGPSTTSAHFGLNGRPLSLQTWYYYELIVQCNNNTLTASVSINGHNEITATLSANFTGTTSFNQAILTCPGGSGTQAKFCDIYIGSGIGGDMLVKWITANNNGHYTQWVSNNNNLFNWQVASTAPALAGLFNIANAVGLKDSYLLTQLPANMTSVLAVQSTLLAEILSGNANIATLYRSGGVDQQGSNIALTVNLNYHETSLASPFTGNNWTVAEVNALEFGQNRTA